MFYFITERIISKIRSIIKLYSLYNRLLDYCRKPNTSATGFDFQYHPKSVYTTPDTPDDKRHAIRLPFICDFGLGFFMVRSSVVFIYICANCKLNKMYLESLIKNTPKSIKFSFENTNRSIIDNIYQTNYSMWKDAIAKIIFT